MTQGDLVMSMDQLLTKPRLGTCHKFYLQPFTMANSKKQLTLPFPEVCHHESFDFCFCFQMS